MEASAKPVFLLTEERQLHSALDIARPPSPPGAVSSSSAHRDDDSRRDRDRDWDKDCDRDEPSRQDSDRGREHLDRERGERDEDREKDRLEEVAEREQREKEQSLGYKKPRKRIIKPLEKFRFSFDWENAEDTSRDVLHQTLHEARQLYGRGFLAGRET
jgi:ATP-dependent RNA helicase DDX23/PRP28